MFKKIALSIAFIALAGLLIFGAVNRTLARSGRDTAGSVAQDSNQGYHGSLNDHATAGNMSNVDHNAANPVNSTEQEIANLPTADPGSLSEQEIADLVYMREEEKLAQDVYLTLYDTWGLSVFENIAASESVHTEAIKALLASYGIDDPVQSQVGVFTDPGLQTLYNQLVARGSTSLSEALKVGAEIEEIDILDLQARIAETDHQDISQVYENLMIGSENHLSAFVRVLNIQTSEVYQPSYLSPEAYQSIVASNSTGNGNSQAAQNGRGGGNNSRRGGGNARQ
jgi:hypothetical protein